MKNSCEMNPLKYLNSHIHVLSAHMADVESNCKIRIACAFEWAAPLSLPEGDCEEADEDDDDEEEGSARGGITNMAQGSDGAAASATNEEDDDEDDAESARSVCNESGASAMTAHREMKLRRQDKNPIKCKRMR